MGEHYYSQSPTSAHDVHALTVKWAGRTLRFETDAGVFSKGKLDAGTSLLLSALPRAFSGRALDLGCGWGAVGACMAAMWPEATVVLTDVNARATALAARNITTNGLTAEVLEGDGLSQLPGCFDLIALNPPIRAGKPVIQRLYRESLERLAAGGALYVVIRKQQGAESSKRFLQAHAGEVDTVKRGGGYHVLRAIMA